VNQDTSLLPPFVPTRRAVRGLGALFVLSAAISWVAVGYDFAELRLVSLDLRSGEEISMETRLAHASAGAIVGRAQLIVLAITGLTFLFWLHRVRVNVRALGVRRLSYGREWTVLGFLVPFVNAFRPYQVVREIWRASDPSTGDPMAWKTLPAPPILAVWWGLFVAYFVLEGLSVTILGFSTGLSRIRLAHGAGFVADLCAALSASFAYFVVVRISEAQDAKRAAHGRGRATDVPFDPRDAVA
jgi:hypothetical protein